MDKTNKSSGGAEAHATVIEAPAPVVVEPNKKKKYSSGPSRAFQELESGLTKSARKVAKAVREGLDTYEEGRDRSAEEKKDGALRDMLRNQSKALRRGLPIAAEAPADFLDAVADMRLVRRFLKR
jgi:hypothetical protein